MLKKIMNELEHSRGVLVRAINNLSTKEIDFLIFPDSKSIGELLLHVAAFEFLMVSASGLINKEEPDLDIWHKLKPGFSREGGFPGPKGYPLDHYLRVLAEIRERSFSYFGGQAERRLVANSGFPIVPLAMLLRIRIPKRTPNNMKSSRLRLGPASGTMAR